MIRLLMAGLLLISVNAVADTQVTHTFKDGDIIKAEEFNQNFDDLESAINTSNTAIQANDAELPPQNCTTDQSIKWDDTNGIWVCVDDPFAGLNCAVGDQLRMGSGGWECRAEPITASLIQNSWDDQNGNNLPISTYFDSLNNVDTSTLCDVGECRIQLIGVADHTSCVVQVTGGAVSGNADVDITTNPFEIRIGVLFTWLQGEAVYINISCTP